VIIMKFGGTSVGSADRIRSLGAQVRERLRRGPVVVVSAFAGVTDQLIRGAAQALEGGTESESIAEELRGRHDAAVHELIRGGPERDRLLRLVQETGEQLRTLYTGVRYLGELSARSLDAISGMGERLSSEIVAAALVEGGLRARAVDARSLIVTDESFGRALPLQAETRERSRGVLLPAVQDGVVPVVPGFIGATRSGVSTTLGRGGSDWSAAILGAACDAEEIQIWTDVDGMLTADPRTVPGARAIPEVSFQEAAELAYFGAKVLHPATIKPAVERGIPVRILNSLNPEGPGTSIVAHARWSGPRAIAFKRGITVILISQPRMLMAHGFVARVFEAFDRHRTAVDLIATSEVSVSLTVDDASRLRAIQGELAALGDVQVIESMAIVSVVGQGFMHQPGLAGRIFQALRDVNLVMISFGASDVNISFVVAEGEAETAVRTLHAALFEEA
jgi:aspartate kinase